MKLINDILSKCCLKPIYTELNKTGVYCSLCNNKVEKTINKQYYLNNAKTKHNSSN